MPKMKTKRALQGRLRVTGTGKLKRERTGRRHLLTGKSAKSKRQKSRPALVSEGQLKMYKRVMGHL